MKKWWAGRQKYYDVRKKETRMEELRKIIKTSKDNCFTLTSTLALFRQPPANKSGLLRESQKGLPCTASGTLCFMLCFYSNPLGSSTICCSVMTPHRGRRVQNYF